MFLGRSNLKYNIDLIHFLCRFLESLEALCKSSNVTESWISAPEFRNILRKLKLHLKDPEFEKLWKRFAFLIVFFFLGRGGFNYTFQHCATCF